MCHYLLHQGDASSIEGPEGGEDEDVQGGLAVVQEGDLVIAIVGIKRDLLSRTVELCSVSLLPHMVSELWELRLTFRWQRPGAAIWGLLEPIIREIGAVASHAPSVRGLGGHSRLL